jgi:hypothetical protein
MFSLWGTNDPEVVMQQTTVTFWPRLALVTMPTYFHLPELPSEFSEQSIARTHQHEQFLERIFFRLRKREHTLRNNVGTCGIIKGPARAADVAAEHHKDHYLVH